MRSRRVWKQQGAREATATAAPPSQEAGIIATASQPGCGGEGKEKQTRTDGQHAICALSLDWAGPPVWLLRAGTADRETEVADEQSAVGLRQARLLALPNRPKHSHGTLVRGRALVLDKLGMMRCVVCQGRFPFRCAAGLFPLQAQTTQHQLAHCLAHTHSERARPLICSASNYRGKRLSIQRLSSLFSAFWLLSSEWPNNPIPTHHPSRDAKADGNLSSSGGLATASAFLAAINTRVNYSGA